MSCDCVCQAMKNGHPEGENLTVCQRFAMYEAGVSFVKTNIEKLRAAFRFILFLQNKFDCVVWIAAAKSLANKKYRALIERSVLRLNKNVYFYSTESISMSDYCYLHLYDLVNKEAAFCVIDEGLLIKNYEAERTRRLLAMSKMFKYRLVLTRLPLVQGLSDLYAPLQFITSLNLGMSKVQFEKCFLRQSCCEDKRLQDEAKLMALIKPYIYDCNLREKFKINYFDYDCKLSKAEERDYFFEKSRFLALKSRFCFLEILQKFQTIYIYAESKIQMLSALLDKLVRQKQKAVVFVRYLDEICFLEEVGVFRKYNYVAMTAKADKKKIIKRFLTQADFMVCTYGVSFMGMCLEKCNHVVFYTQTFDYKKKLQSLGEVVADEKLLEVNVHNFWLNTGLDNLIREKQKEKRGLLAQVSKMIHKNKVAQL